MVQAIFGGVRVWEKMCLVLGPFICSRLTTNTGVIKWNLIILGGQTNGNII